MCFQAKEGPGDSKDPRDTEVGMGGTGNQQNELNEFAIKIQAYLSVYRTEHGSESLIFPFLLESVLRTRSWLNYSKDPDTQTRPCRDKARRGNRRNE